jgi:hypothetical protein
MNLQHDGFQDAVEGVDSPANRLIQGNVRHLGAHRGQRDPRRAEMGRRATDRDTCASGELTISYERRSQ